MFDLVNIRRTVLKFGVDSIHYGKVCTLFSFQSSDSFANEPLFFREFLNFWACNSWFNHFSYSIPIVEDRDVRHMGQFGIIGVDSPFKELRASLLAQFFKLYSVIFSRPKLLAEQNPTVRLSWPCTHPFPCSRVANCWCGTYMRKVTALVPSYMIAEVF